MSYLLDVRYAKLMEMRRENVKCSSVVPNEGRVGSETLVSSLSHTFSLSLYLFFSLSFSFSFNSQGGEGRKGRGISFRSQRVEGKRGQEWE